MAAENGTTLFSRKFSVTAEKSQCEFDFDAFVDLSAVEFRLRIVDMPAAPPAFIFLGAKMTFLGATPARRILARASVHISEHITLLLALIRSRLCASVDPAEIRRRLSRSDNADEAPAYIVIAPYSNSYLRDWPADQYVQLGRAILERTKAKINLLGHGNQKDIVETIAEAIRKSSDGRRVEVATGLGLPEVFNIISSAVTTITNNSGLAHVAAMFGVPSISIYSASHQGVEWGPLGEQSVVVQASVECGPCAYDTLRECLHGQRCMRIISHNDVMQVLERQVQGIFVAKARPPSPAETAPVDALTRKPTERELSPVFRLLFGREPRQPDELESILVKANTLSEVRNAVLSMREFHQLLFRLWAAPKPGRP